MLDALAWFDPDEAERVRAGAVARHALQDTPKVIRRRQAHAADAAYPTLPTKETDEDV